jgi:hypothetical protein
MAIFKFFGRVLPPPPATSLTLTNIPPIHWEESATGLIQDITVSIINSMIAITSNCNRDDFSEAYMRAFDTATAAVDCYSFANGYGLTVILETVVQPDGLRQQISVHKPELAAMVSAFSTGDPVALDAALRIVLGDAHVLLALRDLIGAISVSHYGTINCVRAVESLRMSMYPTEKGDNRNPAWDFMRQNLNLSENYLRFMTKESEGPRHGVRIGTTQVAYHEVINRSWIIMNRFLEFRKRGSQPLPLADFHLL